MPVLFIPGHAGSFRQVRSLAAEAAYYYYTHYEKDTIKWQQGVRNLDFFTGKKKKEKEKKNPALYSSVLPLS